MELVLLGPPLAKARHRSFCRGGRIASYDPQSEQMSAAKRELYSQMTVNGLNLIAEGPVHVELRNYLPIPKSVATGKRSALSGIPSLSKKDIDNLAKFTLDALNGIAFTDDHQVTRLHCTKVYGESPRVEITVLPILPREYGAVPNCS